MVKCLCGICKYCKDRKRYLRERDVRIQRAKNREIITKDFSRERLKYLDDFINGRISLKDVELKLDEI